MTRSPGNEGSIPYFIDKPDNQSHDFPGNFLTDQLMRHRRMEAPADA